MQAIRASRCLFLSILLSVLPALLKAQAHQSVGLVLSGGGAKAIDYITGTSMGAIVGGLYACGYTPAEMMELINSDYFGYLSSGKADPAFTYYFSKGSPSPQMFAMSVGGRDSTARSKIFNPQSLISPMPMSFGFMQIFSAYGAQCDGNFDRLFVPFRCVASDVAQKRKKVMGAGDLGESIRASMSFPLIFQATEIDGQVLYDGGIYDNFPVGVMQTEFAPSVIIGSDVSAPSDGPANSYFQQLDLLVSRAQSYEVPPETGIKVRIDVSNFGLLDWDRADAIYRAGYSRGIEMMDSIKGTHTHPRRQHGPTAEASRVQKRYPGATLRQRERRRCHQAPERIHQIPFPPRQRHRHHRHRPCTARFLPCAILGQDELSAASRTRQQRQCRAVYPRP